MWITNAAVFTRTPQRLSHHFLVFQLIVVSNAFNYWLTGTSRLNKDIILSPNGTLANIIVVLNPTLIILRWEAIRVQAVPPAIQGLLGHDQAPAHPQRRLALPMHHLPGLLPQPVRHAEAHEKPQARRRPPRLAHREDLPVPLLCLRPREWMRRGRVRGRAGARSRGKGNVIERIGGCGGVLAI